MPRKNNYGQFGKSHTATNGDDIAQAPPAKRSPAVPRFFPQDTTLTFKDLGGCEAQQLDALTLAVPLKVSQVLALGIKPKNGVLLHGPPGTGKTSFARAFAGELDIPLFFVSATDIVAGVSGESERRIRELFTEATTMEPAMLVLDEIDGIASKRDHAQREMERRIVSQLITCMDDLKGKKVLVIGTTSRVEVLDPSLRRSGRFDQEISFGIPDERSRLKILEIITKDMKLDINVSLSQLARLTPGYVGSDLGTLIDTVSSCALKRFWSKATTTGMPSSEFINAREREYKEICNELEHLKSWMWSNNPISELSTSITMEDFIRALKVVVPSAKREGFATVPDMKWSDIGALKTIRKELEWSILHPIQQPELFDIFAVNPRPQGILLCGPPGCGKTLLAKAVANETGMNFISIKGPELLSMYVGESERSVRTVFQRARDSSPCVIFFDEIDALCPKRTHSETSGSARLVNQLLTEMDGMEVRKQVFLIGATNRPDMVDPAILRPGRFDQVLFVDFPSVEDREDILEKITKYRKRPRIDPTVDFKALAQDSRLEYFTGADIAALVHEAGVAALKERLELHDSTLNAIKLEHFEMALNKVSPSVCEADRSRYERLRVKFTKVGDRM